MMQKLIKLQREIHKSTIRVEDFNTDRSVIDKQVGRTSVTIERI